MLFPYKDGIGTTARDEQGFAISRRFMRSRPSFVWASLAFMVKTS